MSRISSLEARVSRLERTRPTSVTWTPEQAELFDWYGGVCPCGLEPGKCKVHHRARDNQRPPGGDWRTLFWLAGRGFGKTRTGAEWVRSMAEIGRSRRMAIVAPTAADVRAVMVEGESGLVETSPPWFKPVHYPSKRKLVWPNGAVIHTYSAEEPERLRGPQHDAAWCDELCAWSYPQTWDMLMFSLRLGRDPRVVITTTPKPSKLIASLLAEKTTTVLRGSTYDNRDHLAPTFFDKVIAKYEGTRLGQQEIHAEVLEVSEGAWFSRFDPKKAMTGEAEYIPGLPVYLAIDAGTSRTTAAVWFQTRQIAHDRHRVNIFGEYLHVDRYSEENAREIKRQGQQLPHGGRLDHAYIDPASSQRTSIGPAAYGEYERIFGSSFLDRSPSHRVVEGLDQIELMLDKGDLLIHPRCTHLKAAFQNYRRGERGGELLNQPAIDQSPHEDLMDATRYGIRSRFPEGRPQQTSLRSVSARSI